MKTNILGKIATSRSTVDNAAMPSPVNGVKGRDHLTDAVVTVVAAQRNSARLKSGDASDNTQDEGRGNASAPKHLRHDTLDLSEDKKPNPAGAAKAHGVLYAKGLGHTFNVEKPCEAGRQREEENPDPAGDQSAKLLAIGDMDMAIAFDAVMEKGSGEPEKETGDVRSSRRGHDGLEGKHGTRDLVAMEDALPISESRTEYLAMVAAPGSTTLAPPQLGKTNGLRALRPKSRIECERRCGSDGFCDPSDERGCGGKLCIRLKLTELF
jgi:hypothetical protein